MAKTDYYVHCPLCGDGRMEHHQYNSKGNGREDKSHLWVCDQCPGILVEWWDHHDSKAFNKHIAYGGD